MTRELKVGFYKSELLVYGFLPLLILIERNEKKGRFEECQIIYDAVSKTGQEIGFALPTRFDDNAIQIVKKACEELGVRGEVALENAPVFADTIQDRLHDFIKLHKNEALK